MTLIALRLIDRDLLPAILELDRLCFGGLWTLEGYEREIDSPNSELVAITLDQTLVGYGCLWSIVDEAHITIVSVRPNYQRQGLGQTLLLALLHSAHQRGLERATLEVRISNQSALNLYQKFGFKVAGRRKAYYEDTGEDALILWRGGLQSPDFSEFLVKWESEVSDRLAQHGWVTTVKSDTVTRKKSFLTYS
ncbi:MAG: ribosomal protein S18-alanine N-acetyltransferase [Leptolyngbyaceae cyanobacterium CSU_1_3]|nr:ribosomal protein S18-alanine N-acetyltransferase [Leptolyngbyaceae cyanobacterium CSU_1_3]